MLIRRQAIKPRYVKGGANIFTDAFKKVKKTFKRYMPQIFNFAKNKAIDFVKTEGLKQVKKQAQKHGAKFMEKGGNQLLKMAMGKISNLAGGNIIPVIKPDYVGKGLKYV